MKCIILICFFLFVLEISAVEGKSKYCIKAYIVGCQGKVYQGVQYQLGGWESLKDYF